MGMVMTLVIVVDEELADAAMSAARAASHEHPARVLGVILGDGRGHGRRQRPGRHRLRLERRDRADPAQGRGRQAPRVGGAAPAAARLPRRHLVAGRPARGPRCGPLGAAGAAADHRRGRRPARPQAGHPRAVRGVRQGQHRPRVDADHALARPARRGPGPAPAEGHRRLGRRGDGSARAPTCWPPGWPTGCKVDVEPEDHRRPRHHRGGAGDQRGPDPDLPARRQAGDVHLPRPAGPADRAQAARRCPSCSPRSCAGSTRTTCTPPSPGR